MDWTEVWQKEKALKGTPFILWGGDDSFYVPGWDGNWRDRKFDYDWIVNGMEGEDYIANESHSQDYFREGKNDDFLRGGEGGNDALFGDLGNDTLTSSKNGISLIRGGPGKDFLNSFPEKANP